MFIELNVEILVVLGLASFRLTRLIVYDKITEWLRSPFLEEIMEKDEDGNVDIYLVPKKAGLRKWMGELISCYWCTGIWSSAFLILLHMLFPLISNIVIILLAVAAIGSIVETIVQYFLSNSE